MYSLLAGSPIRSCPGYVVFATGDYAVDALVLVALESSPLVAVGAFTCATIVDAELSTPVETNTTLTKYQFRLRFTTAERYRCDAFNASFETNANIPSDVRAAIRTGLEDYKASQEISLLDPGVHAMLALYEQLGLLDAPGRAAEIGRI